MLPHGDVDCNDNEALPLPHYLADQRMNRSRPIALIPIADWDDDRGLTPIRKPGL